MGNKSNFFLQVAMAWQKKNTRSQIQERNGHVVVPFLLSCPGGSCRSPPESSPGTAYRKKVRSGGCSHTPGSKEHTVGSSYLHGTYRQNCSLQCSFHSRNSRHTGINHLFFFSLVGQKVKRGVSPWAERISFLHLFSGIEEQCSEVHKA